MKYFATILTLSLLSLKLNGAPSSFSESTIEPWGSDHDLRRQKMGQTTKESIGGTLSMGQKSCRAMIRFFQNYISPIDGPRSSYYPTSSQYTLEAIQKHGVLTGIAMGCDRLMRENGDVWVYELTDRYGMLRKIDPVIPNPSNNFIN